MNTQIEIESPCNDHCDLDAETCLCKGCLRTMKEILTWKYMIDDERKEVMDLISERRQKYINIYEI